MDELSRERQKKELDRVKAAEGKAVEREVTVSFDASELIDLVDVLSNEEYNLPEMIYEHFERAPTRGARAKKAFQKILRAGRKLLTR